MKLVLMLVVGTFVVLTLPMQLQGGPAHIQNLQGEMADNVELERAVLQALLSVQQGEKQDLPMFASDIQLYPPSEKKSQEKMAERQNRPERPSSGPAPDQSEAQFAHFYDTKKQTTARRERTRIENFETAAVANNEMMEAKAQYSGVKIEYCGQVGNIIQNALNFGLGFIPGASSAYGVYVACADPQHGYPCTTVTVDVPADVTKADVDVCQLNGQVCVDVYASSCKPAWPIPIVIPVFNGGPWKDVLVTVNIDLLGSGCVEVKVAAPRCPHSG